MVTRRFIMQKARRHCHKQLRPLVGARVKGYDRGDGTFGDLMITYNVKLPTGLNDKQKDLLRQMKDAK